MWHTLRRGRWTRPGSIKQQLTGFEGACKVPLSSLANATSTDTRPWGNEEGALRCDGMAVAVNGDVGTMVETVQRQILRYYTDVGSQATESFESAKRISKWGFILVAVTIGYVVLIDMVGHVNSHWFNTKYA